MAHGAILGVIAVWLAVLYILTADASKKQHGHNQRLTAEQLEVVKTISEMKEKVFGGRSLSTPEEFAYCVSQMTRSQDKNVIPAKDICPIMKSWEPVFAKAEDNGAIILKTFLDKHNYYYKFEKFNNVSRDTIMQNAVFRKHAKKIVVYIDAAVNTLNDIDLFAPLLNNLGVIHASNRISIREFRELKVVILDLLVSTFHISDGVKAAWETFFDAMLPLVSKGIEGYNADHPIIFNPGNHEHYPWESFTKPEDYASCVEKMVRSRNKNVIRGEDICVVMQSWILVMAEPEEYGATILKTFLDKHNYYDKFKKFKNAPRETIKENPAFRKHAKQIILTIDAAVHALQNKDVLIPLLKGLGSLHGSEGITITQFLELKVIILEFLKKSFHVSAGVLASWETMFSAAVPSIAQGINSYHNIIK